MELKIVRTSRSGEEMNKRLRKFKRGDAEIGPIKKPDGELATDDTTKANLFQDAFLVNNKPLGEVDFNLFRTHEGGLSELRITTNVIVAASKKLSNKPCTGADNIQNAHLKKGISVLAAPLDILFKIGRAHV